MAEIDRERDKKLLIEVIEKSEKRLREIVHEHPSSKTGQSRFRKEFLPMLPGPWHEVESRFEAMREEINKNDFNKWEYLEGVGLTGEALKWKAGFLNETVKERTVSRFFKVVKSILGSLSVAFPYAEFIKEFIDIVEAAMKYGRG